MNNLGASSGIQGDVHRCYANTTSAYTGDLGTLRLGASWAGALGRVRVGVICYTLVMHKGTKPSFEFQLISLMIELILLIYSKLINHREIDTR